MTAPAIDRAGSPVDRQRPGWVLAGVVLAVLLVFNGLLTFSVEVLYLPTYIGATPFPISAAFAAVINVVLVVGMGTVVSRPATMSLPVVAWLLGFVVCLSSGPGGDVMLADNWTTPFFLACGIVPAAAYLFWRSFVLPARTAGAARSGVTARSAAGRGAAAESAGGNRKAVKAAAAKSAVRKSAAEEGVTGKGATGTSAAENSTAGNSAGKSAAGDGGAGKNGAGKNTAGKSAAGNNAAGSSAAGNSAAPKSAGKSAPRKRTSGDSAPGRKSRGR